MAWNCPLYVTLTKFFLSYAILTDLSKQQWLLLFKLKLYFKFHTTNSAAVFMNYSKAFDQHEMNS